MTKPMTDPHSTRILSEPADATSQATHPNNSWFYADTHVGRVRSNNEDRFFCDETRGLFVVADGMGGHAAGEEASRITIDIISGAICTSVLHTPPLQTTLADALKQANGEVIRQSENNFQWRGMGSTAVIAIVQGATLYTANVGDSRAYVLRDGRLHQISRDHSVAAVMAEQNQIKPREIRTNAMRNRLTMCLGIEEQINPDTLRLDLERSDCVLLCSDGLWDMLPDEEIMRLLHLYSDPREAVAALIEAANQAGGKDNITAIVLHPQVPHFVSSNFHTTEDTTSNPDSSEDTVILRNHPHA